MTERTTRPASPTPTNTAAATRAATKAAAASVKQPARRVRVKSAASAPKSVARRSPAATATAPKVGKPQRVSAGDTSGSTRPKPIRNNTLGEVMEARQVAQFAAVSDILARPQRSQAQKAESLRAILEGAAPDDAKAIRQLLKGQAKANQRAVAERVDPNEQLAADWRKGAYPYKNLLSRRVYETQKYQLQVELLKLQAWAKETGHRIVILFEGCDAAGKGGTIKRVMEHLNPCGARVGALEKPSEVERGQWCERLSRNAVFWL